MWRWCRMANVLSTKHVRMKVPSHFDTFFEKVFQTRSMSTLKREETVKLILSHTKVTREHMTPEIALRLITPDCTLWHSTIESCPFKEPYWAFYWPGGQSLARYVLDNPNIVDGKTVVDVGSGCGACAIAAAMKGAKYVIANDVDPVAEHAIRINDALNNVKVDVLIGNLIGRADSEWDCFLFGDMCYDVNILEDLLPWFEKLSVGGRTVLLGDPGRWSFLQFKDRFSCVAAYQLFPTHTTDHGFSQGFVWKLLS